MIKFDYAVTWKMISNYAKTLFGSSFSIQKVRIGPRSDNWVAMLQAIYALQEFPRNKRLHSLRMPYLDKSDMKQINLRKHSNDVK